MLAYAIRRLLFFIPTILVVSLIAFGLSNRVAGDPVGLIMGEDVFSLDENPDEYASWLEEYQRTASQYHLDKPKFYFSILPSNYPDTLYRLLPISRQQQAKLFLQEYGDWKLITQFLDEVERLRKELIAASNKPSNYIEINSLINQLGRTVGKKEIKKILDKLKIACASNPDFSPKIEKLDELFNRMSKSNHTALLLPKVVWNGMENQYHYWFGGLLKGDFGVSIVDGKKVSTKIMDALPKTLLLNFLALIVGLFLGFLLGVYLATHSGNWMSKILISKIYAILAIPSFWLASLLVIFFTTSDYGAWTNLFPSGGYGQIPDGASFLKIIRIRLSHLILPTLSIALPLVGVIALQLRRSLVAELKKNYIKTAKLKGISDRHVIWRHGVRNAIFPILAMFSSVLPGMIGGSIAIELIFNIPGMGHLLLHSIYNKDWSVVFGILMLVAVLTVISLLLMDILYAKLNPQVSLKKQSKQ